jgi:hypothetical protein
MDMPLAPEFLIAARNKYQGTAEVRIMIGPSGCIQRSAAKSLPVVGESEAFQESASHVMPQFVEAVEQASGLDREFPCGGVARPCIRQGLYPA